MYCSIKSNLQDPLDSQNVSKDMIDLINNLAVLSSPGLFFELGEFHAYNLIRFFQTLQHLGAENEVVQKLFQISEHSAQRCDLAFDVGIEQVKKVNKIHSRLPTILID